jgi:hypothetical protein
MPIEKTTYKVIKDHAYPVWRTICQLITEIVTYQTEVTIG